MLQFYLFRIKVERSGQLPLLQNSSSEVNSEIIKKALTETPIKDGRHGQKWLIANLEKNSEESMFFKLGKITRRNTDQYDESEKKFKNNVTEEAPYTDVFIDFKKQICGIASKPKLSSNVKIIANHLAGLLSSAFVDQPDIAKIVVEPISDPMEFIKILEEAYLIEEFTLTFSKPNPFDADTDFQKPLQNFAQLTEASGGSTTIKGQALIKDPLVKITKAVAASGNTAQAKVKMTKDSKKAVSKKLSANQATLEQESIEFTDQKQTLVSRAIALYQKIRGPF